MGEVIDDKAVSNGSLVFLSKENLRIVRRFQEALAIHNKKTVLLSEVRLPRSTEMRRTEWIMRVLPDGIVSTT